MVLNTRKSHYRRQQWLWFHVWFIMTLYYKMLHISLQNATIILSQNAVIVFDKIRQLFYYKIRQLLQNAMFIIKCDSTR